jgi:hypothetical protein
LRLQEAVSIPTNFKVPKTLRHEWVLFHQNKPVMVMYGEPGSKKIQQHCLAGPKRMSNVPKGLVLDWIQESVEHLRWLCEIEQ